VYSMKNSVGIRELRQQASSVLKRVVAGETIEVTEHGHPIAHIVPLRPGPLEQLILEGRVGAANEDLLELLDELSLPSLSRGTQAPSKALAELREEEG